MRFDRILGLGLIALGMVSCAAWFAPRPAEEGLRFFGYYHADGVWSTVSGVDAIADMGHANVVWLNGYEDRPLAESLAICRERDLQAILNVYDCFFESNPGRPGTALMHEDWPARWTRLKQSVLTHEAHILAFYFDEPYWNGITEHDFHNVTRMIRDQFPDKRVMAVVSSAVLTPEGADTEIEPIGESYLDWVSDAGFDLYQAWSTDTEEMVARFKTKLKPHHDLWFVTWCFVPRADAQTAPTLLTENLIRTHRLAQREPRAVGILAFSWSGGGGEGWGWGADDLFSPGHELYDPWLKNLHLQIGRDVLGRKHGAWFLASEIGRPARLRRHRRWLHEEYRSLRPYARMTHESDGAWRSVATEGCAIDGVEMSPGAGEAFAARIWRAPRNGTIYVSSNGPVRKKEVGGDGAHIAILHNNLQVWPQRRRMATVAGDDRTGIEARTVVSVRKNDTLAFVVGSGLLGDAEDDTLIWDPLIVYDTDDLARPAEPTP